MSNVVPLRDRLRLYFVLDPDLIDGDPVEVAAAAIRGGVTALQLRCKSGTDRAAWRLARDLRELTSGQGVLLLINDRIDLAIASSADGVHLGVGDLPIGAAREIAGAGMVIGFSPETDQQAGSAAGLGADYLGLGPVFGTASKLDAGEAIGLETVALRSQLTTIPVVGIGGITLTNARSVVASGACGVAVVSAIGQADDPEKAARLLRVAIAG